MKPVGIAFLAILLTASTAGIAAETDNAAPPAAGKPVAVDAAAASYFQGTWAGQWPWGTFGVDVTLEIGNVNDKGYMRTRYTWGSGEFKTGGRIPSGSVKSWGKAKGNKFYVFWKNKEGSRIGITLKKVDENTVHATWETDAPLVGGATMADRQATFKRK